MAKYRFLQAQWRSLVMLNYEVPQQLLKAYLPAGTELDLWQGKALVSMVGFMFLQTRVLGIKWPWHVNFEEVNLRFYVRRFDGKTWKRGAVFISEIVSKRLIAFMANNIYREHYRALPTRHSVSALGGDTVFTYEWKLNNTWNKLAATVAVERTPIEAGSAEEFIFEHYWGYNSFNGQTTMEYEVEHIPWAIGKVKNTAFQANIAELYGQDFVPFLSAEPYSAFFAEGSAIAVKMGEKIKM